MLDHITVIPCGYEVDEWARADKNLWFVTIFDDKKTVLYEKLVDYRMKYIEITEDFRIVTKEEVPSHVLPPPPCPHCLPIENKSEEVYQKLVSTCISFNGRNYYAGDETDNCIDYTAQDHHDSFISLRKSLIGKQNPFLLFKLGEPSRRWFQDKNADKQHELLQRLARARAGGELAKNMELVTVPERTTPFSIKGTPIHIVGECPHCREFPNSEAKA